MIKPQYGGNARWDKHLKEDSTGRSKAAAVERLPALVGVVVAVDDDVDAVLGHQRPQSALNCVYCSPSWPMLKTGWW